MLEEKFYSGENIENKKPCINYIAENRWKVENHIFSNSDKNCIYIQNQYPSNFYSLSKYIYKYYIWQIIKILN